MLIIISKTPLIIIGIKISYPSKGGNNRRKRYMIFEVGKVENVASQRIYKDGYWCNNPTLITIIYFITSSLFI